MAVGLLDRTDTLHLYRHDTESLFYARVILAAHYEIQAYKTGGDGRVRMRRGKLPFERWFDRPLYEDLASFKHTFLSKHGFQSKERLPEEDDTEETCDESTTAPFDDETLGGGHVCYSALIGLVRNLKGKLEDLLIRYDRYHLRPFQPRLVPLKEFYYPYHDPCPIFLPLVSIPYPSMCLVPSSLITVICNTYRFVLFFREPEKYDCKIRF